MFALLLISGLVCLIRPFLIDGDQWNKHLKQSYQAVAHILVGIWATLWFSGDVAAGQVLVIMTIVEVVCAIFTVVVNKERKEDNNG
jgi:Ca2+/Na+ antiporter